MECCGDNGSPLNDQTVGGEQESTFISLGGLNHNYGPANDTVLDLSTLQDPSELMDHSVLSRLGAS